MLLRSVGTNLGLALGGMDLGLDLVVATSLIRASKSCTMTIATDGAFDRRLLCRVVASGSGDGTGDNNI